MFKLILKGKMTLEGGQWIAREMRKTLRCRNYILDIFWKMNGSKVVEWDGERVDLTWDWLSEYLKLTPFVEMYKNAFKNQNVPRHEFQKQMNEYMQRLWEFAQAEQHPEGKDFLDS